MPWYHHPGDSQGFAAYISRYLADDLTIVVLANLADSAPSRIVDGIADYRQRPGISAGLAVRESGVAEQIKGYTELLHSLGAPRRLALLDRRALGDDRAYSYAAMYPGVALRAYFVLAPDGRVADCDVEGE